MSSPVKAKPTLYENSPTNSRSMLLAPLDDYLHNRPMDEYYCCIEEDLEEGKLDPKELECLMLVTQLAWHDTHDSEYLKLLMQALPYYIDTIKQKNEPVPHLFAVRDREELGAVACDYLRSKKPVLVKSRVEIADIKKFLKTHAVPNLDCDPSLVFAGSMLDWRRCKASSIRVVEVIGELANLSFAWRGEKTEETLLRECNRIFSKMLFISNKSLPIFELLFKKMNAEGELAIAKEGPSQELYLLLVRHRSFPRSQRDLLFNSHIRNSHVSLASRMADELSLGEVNVLLGKLKASAEKDEEFYRACRDFLAAKWEFDDYEAVLTELQDLESRCPAYKFLLQEKIIQKREEFVSERRIQIVKAQARR